MDLPARTPWAHVLHGRSAVPLLAPRVPVDERHWEHPEIGWGLVLRDDDKLSREEKQRADDAGPAIARLLAARPGSPVLRWRPELGTHHLRRYYDDGEEDLSLAAPSPGTARGHMPHYLLIYASPKVIPWEVQYALNMSTCVGRLDLEGDALDRYVSALAADWRGMPCQPKAPVVWSVNLGPADITGLMEKAIAQPLWKRLAGDSDLAARQWLCGGQSTGAALAAALSEHTPGLVVTTSHGMTGPLDDGAKLAAQLGMPVDSNRMPLSLATLGTWKPSGAIWYAHACCSAGSDSESRYTGLLGGGSGPGETIQQVALKAGAVVAPLPRALLGATEPLRAFVGHVEPTFDWTLRDPVTHEVLTHVLYEALYNQLYQQDVRTPLGHALRKVFVEAGTFFSLWEQDVARLNKGDAAMRDWALYHQLVAMDRQTTVIIGDPTVSLPPLA
jgi:hypothetical protein